MKALALGLIKAYQRFLSPYKGYHCAFRVHLDAASCSSYALQAIQRWGLLAGLRIAGRRTALCSALVHQLRAERDLAGRRARMHAQSGFCDPGCDASDCSIADAGGCGCDALDLCSFAGDCGGGERSRAPQREPMAEKYARQERKVNLRRASKRVAAAKMANQSEPDGSDRDTTGLP